MTQDTKTITEKGTSHETMEEETRDAEFCDSFGVCPHCGRNDGYLNVGRAHYFICHQHKMKWWIGDNLFSSWRHESETDFQDNRELLQSYQEIDPPSPPAL